MFKVIIPRKESVVEKRRTKMRIKRMRPLLHPKANQRIKIAKEKEGGNQKEKIKKMIQILLLEKMIMDHCLGRGI